MMKLSTILLTTLVLAGSSSGICFADEQTAPQAVAVMGAQTSPVIVNDTAVQKAIEALIKQQVKQLDLKKRIPTNKQDNPIGSNPLRHNENLILGGAEAMPM